MQYKDLQKLSMQDEYVDEITTWLCVTKNYYYYLLIYTARVVPLSEFWECYLIKMQALNRKPNKLARSVFSKFV